MDYPKPLQEGALIERRMRFLAEVEIAGVRRMALCPNTGSMAGLLHRGNPVRISGPHGSHRKYPFTLEQIRIHRCEGRDIWVGVNTAVPNLIGYESALQGALPGLEEYRSARREVSPAPGCRIDLLLEAQGLTPCWVETKNVTLMLPDPKVKADFNQGEIAAFPDARTPRGVKHLKHLIDRVQQGERAAMLFVVQRSDAKQFAPASAFDPVYAEELVRAEEAGVKIIPVTAEITKNGIKLGGLLKRLVW